MLFGCSITSSIASSIASSISPLGPVQSMAGVWVGPCACVRLEHCAIVGCHGPALRIDGGAVYAYESTFAHSTQASNVDARGGTLRMHKCYIHTADGDGITLSDRVDALIDSNVVSDNRHAGIACRSTNARLVYNVVRNNRSGSLFLGSLDPVVIEGNRLDDSRAEE